MNKPRPVVSAAAVIVGLALAAACSPREPPPPPPLPAPSAAPPPPTPEPEPVVSAAPPAAPPVSSVFPALTPAERAERVARAEALLEGGVIPPNDAARNPRTVSVSLVGEAGATGGVSPEGIDTCRHRLFPAPPAELKGKLSVDAGGIVTAAKLTGAANAKAFIACAESVFVGRKVSGPAGDHNIVILFRNAAGKLATVVVDPHRLEDRPHPLFQNLDKLLVHEPIVVRDLQHVDDLRPHLLAKRLPQPVEVLLLHHEDHLGPGDVAHRHHATGRLIGARGADL